MPTTVKLNLRKMAKESFYRYCYNNAYGRHVNIVVCTELHTMGVHTEHSISKIRGRI